MASFIPSKKEANDFNNGVQYVNYDPATGTTGDSLQAETINNLVESALYTQNLVENNQDEIEEQFENINGFINNEIDVIRQTAEHAVDVANSAEEKVDNFISGQNLIAYPVGAIYISTQSTSPANLFGGSWTMLPNGYALWTASSGAGNTISAGLPNITGEFRYGITGKTFLSAEVASGAFSGKEPQVSNFMGGEFTQNPVNSAVTFNANSGATVKGIYGNSSTVQPPAYKIYAWKRTE